MAARDVFVETAGGPIHVTISIGIAAYPTHADSRTDLVHQADVAVYRAKVQGRNRVVLAGGEAIVTAQDGPRLAPAARAEPLGLRLPASGALLWTVGVAGVLAGAAGMLLGGSSDLLGMLAVVGIVGLVQALADGSQEAASVNAVGLLSGAALFGPRVALPVAACACVVEWGRTRTSPGRLAFDIGTLTIASLAAAAVFALRPPDLDAQAALIAAGVLAGVVYFAVAAAAPLAIAARLARTSVWNAWRAALGWPFLQIVAAGLLAGVVAIAYSSSGLWTLALIAVPLLLARSTQDREAARAQRRAVELQSHIDALEERAGAVFRENVALQDHATALIEALTTLTDERETAGHSREVQRLAVAVGNELRLSSAELDVLAHAALLHDLGKLAVPYAVLLKEEELSEDDWEQLRDHAGAGARLVGRLAYLSDAVPAIRHHHERYDGLGYPDGLTGEEIPLGARVIHVAEATVSMLNATRDRLTPVEIIAELKRCAGTQFCPRCVDAMEAIAAAGLLTGFRRPGDLEPAR